MKKLLVALCVTCALSLAAHAGGDKKKGDKGGGEMTEEQKALRAEMLKKYDTNNDGKLDAEEKAKISDEDKAKMGKAKPASGEKTKKSKGGEGGEGGGE
jgi:hypothetical protein